MANKVNEPNQVRIKLFEGEDGKLLATVRLKLKPYELRFYNIGRISRVEGKRGLVVVDSEKLLVCEGHLVNKENPLKVIDYRMIRVDDQPGCC